MDQWRFLEALQDFNDFLRAQKGAYGDACAGYRRNEISIKLQAARVLQLTRSTGKDGRDSVISTSVEDPTAPDVIIQTIRLSTEYLDANSRAGTNEQQMSRALVVFIFTYWEVVIRHRCAAAMGIGHDEVKLAIAGDLRHLRIAILHHGGILRADAHRKLEILGDLFAADAELSLPHATMKEIFRRLDQQLALFSLEWIAAPPPPLPDGRVVSHRVLPTARDEG